MRVALQRGQDLRRKKPARSVTAKHHGRFTGGGHQRRVFLDAHHVREGLVDEHVAVDLGLTCGEREAGGTMRHPASSRGDRQRQGIGSS